MINLSVRRPVATAGIYIALLALGAYSFRLIPIELLPDVDYPRLTLTANWSGSSPEAMEAFVTAPLEAAAQQVQDARKITSRTRTNRQGTGSRAEIEIEFIRDARMEFAELELRERVSSLRDELPPGVQPTVIPYVPPEFSEEAGGFLSFQLRGPYTFGYLAEMADESISQRFLAIDGVSAVNVRGAEGRELLIELDPRRLEAHGLTAAMVQARIAELETLVAPGSVLLEGQQVALSVRTRADEVADIRELVIDPLPDNPVRLADVGRVRDRTADPTMYFRINGQPTVTLDITKQPRVNSVRVADRVKAEAEALAPDLPAGTTIEVDIDQSKDIRSQLTDLRLRAMAAGIVIFLVLILFLRSLGSALVIFATIGFSVLIAINFLYLGGFSLNVLTLAGLAWGFGLVVDNSIVVLENVERHRASGKSAVRAAREGARQVVLPVLAATATTAIVLVPFLFLQGDLRVYYLPLAFAVGFSIVASLFVAFSFVPTMTARFGRNVPAAAVATTDGLLGAAGDAASGASGGAGERHEAAYIRGYRSLLSGALAHPFVVAFVCLAALAGSWYLFDEHVNKNVRWASFWGQQTYISIYIEFPRGAGLARTDELARSFEGKLSQLTEVDRFETTVMDQYAFIRVTFPEEIENTPVPPAIKEQMVAYSHQFTGARVRVWGYGPSFYGGGNSPPNYTIRIFGYNYLKVREIAEDMASRLERFGRIQDVDPNAGQRWYERDKEFEYFLAVDRNALAAYDVSVEELLRAVSANIQEGTPSTRLRLGGEEIPYAVKLAGYDEFDLQRLEHLRLPAGADRELRLLDVASVEERKVLSSINRENQQYERRVAWEFRGPRKLGDAVRDVVLEATVLPPGYRLETRDEWSWPEDEQEQVVLALIFAVLLIYMVAAALFESLTAPLVVLLTLPLALIGVFLIFFYTDASFTDTAYIGAIMMGGIVVNNAILIVYHIGELRQRLPIREAIITGTLERVRPILMTTFTTVFGLLPLVLFASSQDENIWNALALATIGGLLSSTLFVLVAIPVAYRYIVARKA